MQRNKKYINSVNLNADTNFPYLVLNVENESAVPLNQGFRVMHWHEDLQFIYVINGQINVKTLDEVKTISAGEAVFINKNVVHLIEKINICKYKSFLFPDYFLSFYLGSPASELTQSITENKKTPLIILNNSLSWSTEAINILKELAELENNKNKMYCYEVLVMLSSLWLLILKNTEIPQDLPDNIINIRIRKFLQYIEAHYSENITLDELAQSANVSKSECLRCFKSSLQTTPYKYLMDFRLAKAARLLKETDLPISEISAEVGFSQQSYFGKCFKVKVGCSPSEYRLKIQRK